MARVVRLQRDNCDPSASPIHSGAEPSTCCHHCTRLQPPFALLWLQHKLQASRGLVNSRSSTGFLIQGAPQRRQLAERIYAYEAALPEDLLQQGIGPPGNTNRLLKVFNKLMKGQPCVCGSCCSNPSACCGLAFLTVSCCPVNV